ncbi:acylpyruvate hydrolase [Acrasis kona]|uniref:Acylpyruvate hydrolase n=1 Tax=Acrasis kona TaxID=1008807 RepID=A0AAW2ZMT8_9EUKA
MLRKIDQVLPRTKKLLCLLRNYELHAKEMKGTVLEDPIFFIKPSTSILPHKNSKPFAAIELPEGSTEVHHELELGVVISKGGRNIPEKNAMDHVLGYCLTLDMTERTVQAEAKKKGQPWSAAKGYDTFCPIGDELFLKEDVKDVNNLELFLNVNGQERQRDSTKNMIHSIPRAIAYISRIMKLEDSDIILMGTPAGVGPVKQGDVITCGIKDLSKQYTFVVENKKYTYDIDSKL